MTELTATPRRPMGNARRLRIWERHKGVCVLCNEKIDGVREAWTVEHIRALGLAGADEDENCGPAHERCRRVKDKADVKAIAKAKRVKGKHIGAWRSSSPMPGSRASGWKIKMDRTVERRS